MTPETPPEMLALLRRVDTPTVCNAIEVAQGKRGFSDFTRGTMVCTEPGQAVEGYAATARIAGARRPRKHPRSSAPGAWPITARCTTRRSLRSA